MTAQIGDTVVYENRDFSLAGINGDGLFKPTQIGLKVVMFSTACWDGFYCTYTVADGSLYLTKLTVGFDEKDRILAEKGEGPIHFGTLPQRDQQECVDAMTLESVRYWGDWYHQGFNFHVAFSGGLLIADGFIPEMYVHMGHHPAYKFREVHELIFGDGRLISATDRSEQMAEFREMIADRPLKPTDPRNRMEIKNWIERAFSRDYNW